MNLSLILAVVVDAIMPNFAQTSATSPCPVPHDGHDGHDDTQQQRGAAVEAEVAEKLAGTQRCDDTGTAVQDQQRCQRP